MSAVDDFLKHLAETISTNLVDPLVERLGEKAEEMTPSFSNTIAQQAIPIIIPPLVDAVIAEFEKQMPMLIEAVVRAVATSMSDLFARTEDRATDMIPGPIDDIIDPLVKQIMSGLFGTNEPGGQQQ